MIVFFESDFDVDISLSDPAWAAVTPTWYWTQIAVYTTYYASSGLMTPPSTGGGCIVRGQAQDAPDSAADALPSAGAAAAAFGGGAPGAASGNGPRQAESSFNVKLYLVLFKSLSRRISSFIAKNRSHVTHLSVCRTNNGYLSPDSLVQWCILKF